MSEQQATGQDTGQTTAADATAAGAAQAQTDQQQGAGTQQGAAGQQNGQKGTQANGAAKATQATEKAAGSAATGDGEDDRTPSVGMPDDWRDHLSGGDEKIAKLLGRFHSPASIGKALLDARAKLSQGAGSKEKPGDDATDEEKAAWREAQGVPKAAEDYEKGWKAPEGFILSDTDKVLMKGFAAHVHGQGWTQEHFNGAMGWYVKHMADMQAARQDMDLDMQAEAIRELKAELGPADYRRGIQSIGVLRQHEPEEGLLNAILDNARMPDGRKLGDIPNVVRMVMAWAAEIDPQSRIAPADPNMSGVGLEARLAEISALMGSSNPDEYNKYWGNPTLQAEYGRLLEVQERLAKRRAA